MHKEIIIRAFEKVKKEVKREVGILPSVSSCAKQLSLIITEEYKFPYGEKSLRNLFNLALRDSQNDFEIKQPQVVNGLCNYLGFDNYESFVFRNYSHINERDTIKNDGSTIIYSETVKKNDKNQKNRERNSKTAFKIIVSIKLQQL